MTPLLLRIISHNDVERFEKFHTGTNGLRLVFQDNPPDVKRGFFVRMSYQATDESCSGKGTNNDQCACVITGGDDHCAVTGNNGFTPITLPTDDDGLSYACGTGIVRIQLDYTSTASSAILSTNSYFMDTLSPPQECRWDITGPEDSQLAIIFRGFNLLRSEDRFSLKYGDGRGAEEFLRYSSDVTDIPVTRAGQTISILDTPITFDSNLVKINYKSGDSTVFTTNKGALFEVRLLGVGECIIGHHVLGE
ncbi:hypothetical protein BSL78_01829 [Apostichopus japonicus]|uniref:CUB domain-containing protein n=1 Tax=Stichopus japonicus TaxID=307972 RepID=A0A2G8LM70_STIJA|nr:hypothetical protein BSL78_01829 [Apostichopus japonicus]